MRSQLFNILAVFFILASSVGCRTYGGYGTEQASYDQIMSLNARFTRDLERARGELLGLQQAAGSDVDLKAAVAQYEMLLEKHEAMVAQHDELAGTLTVKTGLFSKLTTSYRDLNRAFGYIVAEQKGMKDQYTALAASLIEDDRQRAAVQVEQGRYQIAPPFYEQIRFALANRSISDALDVRAGS